MSQPGWYPDPADSTQLRYWSGLQWTTQTRPALDPTPPRRGRWWPFLAAGALVIALVVVVAWLGRLGSDVTDAGPAPTGSVWNESEQPTSPTPAALNCGDRAPNTGALAVMTIGRLTLGNLSMPQLSNWSGPYSEQRLPYGRDGWAYQEKITTETKRGWASSAGIGFTAFSGNPTVTKMAETIAQCVSSSAYYSTVKVEVTSMKTTQTKISGFEAAQTDVLLKIDSPDLITKGSRLRIIVTRTSGQPQYFFSAVPIENTEHQALIDKVTRGLSAS